MYPYNNKNYINIFIKEPYKSNLMYVIPNFGLHINDNLKGNLFINIKINNNIKNNNIYDDFLIPKIINPFDE